MISDLITGKEIVEGVVIGVSSGIILSLIFWLNKTRDAKVSKRKEIERLRQIILDFRGRIYELEGGDGDSRHKQTGLFFSMLNSLDLAIQNYSSHLSYLHILEIKNVVDSYSGRMELAYDTGLYNEAFDRLEKKEWLKLPKRDG